MAYLRVPTPSPAGRTDRRLEYRLTTVSPIDSAFRLSPTDSTPPPLLPLALLRGTLFQDSWVAHACWSFTPLLLRRPKPSPVPMLLSPFSLLPLLPPFLLSLRLHLLTCTRRLPRRCKFQASRSDVLYPSEEVLRPFRFFPPSPVVVPLFRLAAGKQQALGPSARSQDPSEIRQNVLTALSSEALRAVLRRSRLAWSARLGSTACLRRGISPVIGPGRRIADAEGRRKENGNRLASTSSTT